MRQELQQATALADTQARVVDAERKVTIAQFEASAAVKFAEGNARSKTINAEADATVLRVSQSSWRPAADFLYYWTSRYLPLVADSLRSEPD